MRTIEKDLPAHYNGWQIVDDVWVKIPSLPGSNPGNEGLRCFAMKHVLRLEGKDDPLNEVQKALNYITHLSKYYGGSESPLVSGNVTLGTVRDCLHNSPRGFDSKNPIDQLRLEILCNLANACQLNRALEDLMKLRAIYKN